jgi:arylsulfatase A-like enzyme
MTWSLEPTRRSDAISLLPALEGRRPLPDRDILLENLDEARVPKQPLYAGIRNRRFSHVEYEPRGAELYDMRADPHQLRSLAGDPTTGRTSAASPAASPSCATAAAPVAAERSRGDHDPARPGSAIGSAAGR